MLRRSSDLPSCLNKLSLWTIRPMIEPAVTLNDPDLEDDIKSLNEKLVEYLASYPFQTDELFEAAAYSVESPGHRWRPILFLKIFQKLAHKTNYHDVLPIACAIEFLHTASIILDDLPAMDDGTLRRGKRPCHLEFGQPRALLTALWLCDVAQYLIHDFQLRSKLGCTADLEELLRSTKNEMMKGQTLDLEGENLTDNEILEKYRLKSGALYSFTACVPAYLLAQAKLAEHLKEFGNNLAVAYQISDDIHDCMDTAEDLGKDVNKDKNKDTIPLRRGIRKAAELKDFYKQKAINELSNIPAPIDDLVSLVEKICT